MAPIDQIFSQIFTGSFFRLSYVHKITNALIFSCLGDALLNHDYFVYGMCAFAVAQLFYIMAFGFQPLKLWIGILLYSAGAASNILLRYNCILEMNICSSLSSIEQFQLSVYYGDIWILSY